MLSSVQSLANHPNLQCCRGTDPEEMHAKNDPREICAVVHASLYSMLMHFVLILREFKRIN